MTYKNYQKRAILQRAAASYAKYNRVDLEDEQTLPYDMIVVQPSRQHLAQLSSA